MKFNLDKLQREGNLEKAGKLSYQDIPAKQKEIQDFSKKFDKNILIKEEVSDEVIAQIVSK